MKAELVYLGKVELPKERALSKQEMPEQPGHPELIVGLGRARFMDELLAGSKKEVSRIVQLKAHGDP